jgi:peptide/nickel transport system ATP-binding protein
MAAGPPKLNVIETSNPKSMTAAGGSQSERPLLSVRDLRVEFDLRGRPLEVVKGVSFDVQPGKVTALVGESGSGKSVISQCVMGILPKNGMISGGNILFNDPAKTGEATNIAQLLPSSREMRDIRGGRISIIFQEPMTSLSPVHTIGNQIEEALRLHSNVSSGEARNVTEAMLARVGFPYPSRAYDMYAFELSGGLRQRAMIAMALICRPALLIADEPTTALDVTVQAQVLGVLRELQAEMNMAMMLITHDLGVVANMADTVVVIYHGEIMEAGPAEAIFRRPQHPYLKALLAAVPHFDMKPGERLVSLRDPIVSAGEDGEKDIEAKRQNAIKNKAKAATRMANLPSLLSVRDLGKSFTSKNSSGGLFGTGGGDIIRAVDRVSFDVGVGECLGLVGESGCGKTTVSKLITRAITPSDGEILFRPDAVDGKDTAIDLAYLQPGKLKPYRPAIQMVFQDPFGSLNPRMTVLDILREPLAIHGIGNHDEQNDRIKDLMRKVGLDPRFLGRYPHSFSGGQRQRIGIARALALNPKLVICDEPVSALDVSVQAQILNLLKDLQDELGLTYLFISHNLAVVDYMADRIAVMWKGRIVEIAPRETLFRNPRHPYTRTLLEAVPYPDLDRPLDFDAIRSRNGDRAAQWPNHFRDSGSADSLHMIEIEAGHQVLAQQGTEIAQLNR